LLLARYDANGARLALFLGTGFALLGAILSLLRLSPTGARGAATVQVREGQRLAGDS
jgi:DHA2 family multidrug resistance protein-like MFS transporter